MPKRQYNQEYDQDKRLEEQQAVGKKLKLSVSQAFAQMHVQSQGSEGQKEFFGGLSASQASDLARMHVQYDVQTKQGEQAENILSITVQPPLPAALSIYGLPLVLEELDFGFYGDILPLSGEGNKNEDIEKVTS